MFNHNHGVAQVAQEGQRLKQAVIISLVQADGGFVEYIHHTDQPGTYLAGKANALRFTTGQGFCATAEGEVIQPDIDQKTQTFLDLLGYFFGNLAFTALDLELVEKIQCLAYRQVGDFRQGDVIDEYMAS